MRGGGGVVVVLMIMDDDCDRYHSPIIFGDLGDMMKDRGRILRDQWLRCSWV